MVQILQQRNTECKFFTVLRVVYRITFSADTVPFRICYCITEVLYDRSDHVKASVLWRHGERDFIGFYWDPYEMSVTNHPRSVIEKYGTSSTRVHRCVQRRKYIFPDPLPKAHTYAANGRTPSCQTPPPQQHTRPTAANQIKVLYDLVRP